MSTSDKPINDFSSKVLLLFKFQNGTSSAFSELL